MLSEKEDTDLRKFYDLSTNEVFQVPLPEARGRKILGSAHGWLITVDEDGQFNVLNPLNRMQIALPPQSSFQSVKERPPKLTPQEVRDMFPLRATLAPDPASGDFIAMVVHLGFDTTCLSFCRSSDNGWTRFETLGVDAVLDFADGHFYSTNMGGEIFHNEISTTPKMELIAGLHPYDITGSYYVVECDGEILVVSRFRWVGGPTREPWDGTNHYTNTFKVYKLNLKDKLLTEIYNIGDNALFVGFNSTLCLPATTDIKAYKKNCIYFTDDYHDGIFGDIEDIGGLDMGVFNLDDGTIEPHYPGVSKSNFSLPIWFVPNPC